MNNVCELKSKIVKGEKSKKNGKGREGLNQKMTAINRYREANIWVIEMAPPKKARV